MKLFCFFLGVFIGGFKSATVVVRHYSRTFKLRLSSLKKIGKAA
jgi:hypothetical protein